MTKIYRLVATDDDLEAADRQTSSLAGLALTLLIVVVCLFVFKELQSKTAIEDCLMAGRTNCDILVARIQ
ncbi:hypothetical protein [Limobrevibacterium gyesilva]|uniref:Uncharacterized protein n=1 Tax=Limobrevibacterium gyesilva TaxID=2991712 RepID=A0AA41YNI6_9PROT|nr:hypothetical protein [Limobrevibacterium gyesilva]MCW3477156.1 hypothetical protein [Limobrevibacterium gyesilva]